MDGFSRLLNYNIVLRDLRNGFYDTVRFSVPTDTPSSSFDLFNKQNNIISRSHSAELWLEFPRKSVISSTIRRKQTSLATRTLPHLLAPLQKKTKVQPQARPMIEAPKKSFGIRRSKWQKVSPASSA
jgi:hypothetical protein